MSKSRIEMSKHGYYFFRKHNGIRYDLNHGVTIGKELASDIIYIMLEAYDDIPCEFVGWMFGCTDLENNCPNIPDDLDYYTDKWEQEHPDIVARILNGEVEEY